MGRRSHFPRSLTAMDLCPESMLFIPACLKHRPAEVAQALTLTWIM